MKKLIPFILMLSLVGTSLAGDTRLMSPVRWNGKVYANATAAFRSGNIYISAKNGSATIPWEEADSFLQFKFKKEREAWEEKEAARAEAAKMQTHDPELFHITGMVLEKISNGYLVTAWKEDREPVRRRADSMARRGIFVGGSPSEALLDFEPEPQSVEGVVFVRGLQGLAATESVDCLARKTEEFLQTEDGVFRIFQFEK